MTTPTSRTRSVVALLLLGSGPALIGDTAHAQRGSARARRGDTVVVANTGNGLWGPAHDAIEVKRISGDTKETTFGVVYTLAATPDGGVLVFDTKSLDGLIIRQFDADGHFVRNIGRRGEGPGEYVRPNLRLAVHTNGTIIIRDSEKSVSRFAPDGKLLSSFSLFHTNGSTNEVFAATDGSIYLRAPFIPGPEPTGGPGQQRPILHYDVSGRIVDSISTNARWVPTTTDPAVASQWWSTLPDGRLLYTRTDRVGFLIIDRTGRVPPFIAEAPSAPVPYLKEERDELQGLRDFTRDNCMRPGMPAASQSTVPETKLPARGGSADLDGRIWIAKTAAAKKVPPKIAGMCGGPGGSKKYETTYEEPPAYVAFQPDGTLLGEVRFPLRARVTFVGNTAWAMVPDADDVPVLIKYKLHN